MFIRIIKNDKILYLNQKDITSFQEVLETVNDERTVVELKISAEGLEHTIKGNPEELNEIVTQIVRQNPIAESIQSETMEAIVRSTTTLLKQNAGLAVSLRKLQERVSKLDGIKEPAKAIEEPTAEEEGNPKAA